MSRAAYLAHRKHLREIREKRQELERREIARQGRLLRGEKPLICYFCHNEDCWTFAELSAHVLNDCPRAPLPRGGGFEPEAAELLAANMMYPTQRSKNDVQHGIADTQG